jgi:hypothetical protein
MQRLLTAAAILLSATVACANAAECSYCAHQRAHPELYVGNSICASRGYGCSPPARKTEMDNPNCSYCAHKRAHPELYR